MNGNINKNTFEFVLFYYFNSLYLSKKHISQNKCSMTILQIKTFLFLDLG